MAALPGKEFKIADADQQKRLPIRRQRLSHGETVQRGGFKVKPRRRWISSADRCSIAKQVARIPSVASACVC